MIERGLVNHFPVYCDDRWGAAAIRHGFGCRDVTLAQYCPDVVVVATQQVHGAVVHCLQLPVRDDIYIGDAFVTNCPGVVVAVRTADCVPLLAYHPQQRVVAAIHAGWRGVVAGVIEQTIATAATEYGADPAGWQIAVGPCIGAAAFEVDAPVLDALAAAGLPVAAHSVPTRAGHALCDLRQLAAAAAIRAGVLPQQCAIASQCTVTHRDDFYSWRRDRDPHGRQINFIQL